MVGDPSSEPRKQPVSRQRCLAAVAAYAAEAAARGEHPGLVGYERAAPSHGWPSRTTVRARLGPWTAALAAAGVAPCLDAGPSRGDCLGAVRAYVTEMADAGRYPTARGYAKLAPTSGWPGPTAVATRLGSWRDALAQVGFSRERRPGEPYVTCDDCVAAIRAYVQEAAATGRHPGTIGYDTAARDRGWPDRQHTVIPRLGSWSAALEAAEFGGRRYERAQTVSRDDCLTAVCAYIAEQGDAGLSPTASGYSKLARTRGWPAVSTVMARLGPWAEALRVGHPHI